MAIVCFPSPSFPDDAYPDNYWPVAPSTTVVAASVVNRVRCLDDEHDWYLNPALIEGMAKIGRR